VISTPVGNLRFALDVFLIHFPQGAMENWGLITGRTTAFLLDPKNSDLSAKKNVMATQSHEVAHMWLVKLSCRFPVAHSHRFGNITTMEWWNYLYLNEGDSTQFALRQSADNLLWYRFCNLGLCSSFRSSIHRLNVTG